MARDTATFEIRVDDDSLRRLVALLKAHPDRLDKELRARFRVIAKKIRDQARERVREAKPQPKTPRSPNAKKPKGDYHWSQLVNTITSGADSDNPWVKYGSDRTEGAMGWEFGSDKWPQFPPRSGRGGTEGYNFFPAVRELTKHIDVDILEAAEEIARKYFS